MKEKRLDLENIRQLLKNNSWEIIEEWKKAVTNNKQIRSSRGLSPFELINGLPVVLLAISESITKPLKEELKLKGLFGNQASNQAKNRFDQNYSLNEIFREYIQLRESILSYLRKRNVLSEEDYLLHSRLGSTLDEQLLTTIEAYANNFNKQLKHKAMIDSLTNLYNRATFFELLEKEISKSTRYKHPTALLMLDLDNFKFLNDKFGHLAGDNYLKYFGSFLIEKSRDSDIVGRIGGDEFAILLPETDVIEAIEAAHRLQSNFITDPQLQLTNVNIGLSIGVAKHVNQTPLELYNNADNALMIAKKRGISQIVAAGEDKVA